ncbi:MAG: LUD domain-containing protein [Bacteroidetes bacterium]|nr:LUD domain-containing protein [Bacteroidota bacterium]
MEDSTSREKILKKVRKALINQSTYEIGNVDFDSEIYHKPTESYEVLFAQNFSALNGKFIFCESEAEFSENIKALVEENKWSNITCLESNIQQLLTNAAVPYISSSTQMDETDIGITSCECLVARLGSIYISSKQQAGRRLPVFANIHIVVAYTSQLVYHIKDALKLIKNKYPNSIPSMIASIAGPSRTADIEKTLVQGAHGPKDIYCFLIDDYNVDKK